MPRGLSPFLLPSAPLSARAVTKRFARGLARSPRRVTAIDSIDIDVYRSELIALVGGAGAGKTTLLQCLAGLLKPDSGTVELFGERFAPGWSPPGLSYVPAIPVFYPFLTPLDVVELAMVRNPDFSPPRHSSAQLLELLELDRLQNVKVAALPRELLRRVSIAQALAPEPSVVLVDSSPSDLSAPFDQATIRTLAARAEEGVAVVLAAREGASVAFAASRLFLMNEGKTVRTFAIESYGEPLVAGLPVTTPRIVAERLH